MEMLLDFLGAYPSRLKVLNLLGDRAVNDPNEQLRQWAQEQLEKLKMQNTLREGHNPTEFKMEG
ncbi:hypothetical protein XM38_022080 [Halomicronema hongdechloris C2206]|uniref:Uncharacterized protein n=2 Tax=Halomicronema hongdechloris TaxID=1209493 RepID=A0A1Z3HLV4_9CYAN|nr:hypothetical protein XM38_022080 [Halomicronema hongdechloris C2206]